MTRTQRRSTLALATLLGAAALAPPLGAVAHAAGGPEAQFYVAVKDGGVPALYGRSASAALSPAGAEVLDLRASRDGSRLVDVESSLDGTGSQVQSVVVYDVSGNRVRVATSVGSSVSELRSPALSPDGSTVVWTRNDYAGPTHTLLSTPVAGGAETTLGTDLYDPVFLDASTLLVRRLDGTAASMPAGGGSLTDLPSLPWESVGVTVSPDGSKLAWEDEKYTTPATGDVHVAPLSMSGGVTVGTPTPVATGQDNFAPAFSRDGTHVLFVHNDGAGGTGARYSAPVDASSAPVALDSASLGDVRTQTVGEVAAPLPLTQTASAPATLSGTVATVRWTDPGDANVSGVQVTRSLGTTLQRTVFVSLPTTTYRDTGLVVGQTYTYTFSSVDRSGHVAPSPVSRPLTAAVAAASFADPTARVSTRAPFPVRFGPGSPAVRWTVDYRVNSASAWTRWVNDVTGTLRTFGSAARTGVAATTSVPGRTYQFRVSAVDAYGNSTPTVVSLRTVVPFDQTKATLSGGLGATSSSAYFGTFRRLSTRASYARIALYGNRLQVVGWKCRACGSFAVFDGATRIATVSSYATATVARTVLFTKTYATNATHTFTIRPLGTAGHPAVIVDGFAMRR